MTTANDWHPTHHDEDDPNLMPIEYQIVTGFCDDEIMSAIYRGPETIGNLGGRLLTKAMETIPDSERKLEYFELRFVFQKATLMEGESVHGTLYTAHTAAKSKSEGRRADSVAGTALLPRVSTGTDSDTSESDASRRSGMDREANETSRREDS